MKKRILSVFLTVCMILTLAPAAFAADTDSTPANPPAAEGSTDTESGITTPPPNSQATEDSEEPEVGDESDVMTLTSLLDALAAAADENSTVTLTNDITITQTDLDGLTIFKNGAVIKVPEGVTLEGAGYSITAKGWDGKNMYHILAVEHVVASTTTTIQNLTIVGDENTKSGILAHNCAGTVALKNVTIQNCGNAAVQVNGAQVTATGLNTSGNDWGAVNVDIASATTGSAHFELTSGELQEPLKIWTELKGENIVSVPASWATVHGTNANSYAPADTLTENVVYNDTTGKYYKTLELAVSEATAGDVLEVYPGDYNIKRNDTTVHANETGWYLPIDKSLTLKGVDADGAAITDASKTLANIYSTVFTENGQWSSQNLITVFADDVVISGLTIMNKIDVNKAIEVVDVDGFVIENCAFAPISAKLFEEAQLPNGYTYDKYKDCGATLYFNGDVNATVTGNSFDRSSIAFDSTTAATITVTGNTFEGVKLQPNPKDFSKAPEPKSTISYVTWTDPPTPSIADATISIEKNQFINAGKVNFSIVTAGTVDVSKNYWEGMSLADTIVGGDANAVKLDTIYADKAMTETVNVVLEDSADSLQMQINKATPGETINLEGNYYAENLLIDKSITLTNGHIDTIAVIEDAVIGDIENLTFDNLTFRGVTQKHHIDVNPSALYLQGNATIKNVLVSNCTFQGPVSDMNTIAIVTLNVDGLTVKDCTIDGYTISAYHNPGTGGNITYQGNTITDVKSGIAFIGTDGVTVKGNTFENANGIRLEPKDDSVCKNITIEKNKFLSVSSDATHGQYAVRAYHIENGPGVEAGELALDHNYWGAEDPDFDALILVPEGVTADPKPYYEKETMRTSDLSNYTGGGSSGGSSSDSGYAVTVDKATNGTVTVSTKNASKGSTVTITVKPDSGYELDELIVTDKNNDKIKLTDKGNGKYTFTMPASKVEVEASFNPIDQQETKPFNDVSKNDYYYDAVLWAVDKGITSGTSATTFAPNDSCTRAQMVTFLWRAAGSPAAKSAANPFTDIQSGAYYYDAVLWAVEQNITSGTSATTFAPDATVTRGQTVTFLYRANGSPAASGSNAFTDVTADAYYAAAVQWAVTQDITSGTSTTTFSPLNDCTRGQIVTFLNRAEK